MDKKLLSPDYLFEVSWEVCNKVGGIYTVISTKALHQKAMLGRRHIMVGPDVWMHTEDNPDFIEDAALYRNWKVKAAEEGIRVRIGRWNVPGKPVAILVDYKQFLPKQDQVLAEYWKRFGVDSLTGNWDYKESALFGYAAGRVIVSFYRFNLYSTDKVVAQFHEWQTGAGLLYIKDAGIPVATVFTTHATMMGRCICGNNLPLYKHLEGYDGDEMARRFGVVARHSLEKMSARNADVFTTVSDITARECKQFHGRPVDIVTPNGFENSFTPASDKEWKAKRAEARERLISVASAMCGAEVPKDAVLVGIGGRYEYRNKGIDVFIDALAKLKGTDLGGKEVHAFIMIPSGHNGPDRSLMQKMRAYTYYQTHDGDSSVYLDVKQALADTNAFQRKKVISQARIQAFNEQNDVQTYNSIIDSDREYINRHWIELMRKFTLSVACLLLFLIGAPFGSIVRKGGLGMPLVASVIFFVLYYVIGMISEKSVRESAVGPVGMWVSTFVFIPIGALLTWQATTDSSLFDLATWKRWLRIKNRHKHKPDSQ